MRLLDGHPGLLGNIPQCTRKDLRNAVEAAAKAGRDVAPAARALELDPDHADAHVNLGRLLHERCRGRDTAPVDAREVPLSELYREDGIRPMAMRQDEVLTDITLPEEDGWRSTYLKLRDRNSFDFPIAAVAAFLVSGEMAVAYFMAHAPQSFFPAQNGGGLIMSASAVAAPSERIGVSMLLLTHPRGSRPYTWQAARPSCPRALFYREDGPRMAVWQRLRQRSGEGENERLVTAGADEAEEISRGEPGRGGVLQRMEVDLGEGEEGGIDQIDFDNEDTSLRKMYEEECAKNGVKVDMG